MRPALRSASHELTRAYIHTASGWCSEVLYEHYGTVHQCDASANSVSKLAIISGTGGIRLVLRANLRLRCDEKLSAELTKQHKSLYS